MCLMNLFLLSLILTFVQSASFANTNSLEEMTYLSLAEDIGLEISRKEIMVMNIWARVYHKPIIINDSVITNLSASRTKYIKGLKIKNTNFYFAKLAGIVLEDCLLENVNFNQSDLTFVNFKNCTLNNVKFKDTIMYGVKNNRF